MGQCQSADTVIAHSLIKSRPSTASLTVRCMDDTSYNSAHITSVCKEAASNLKPVERTDAKNETRASVCAHGRKPVPFESLMRPANESRRRRRVQSCPESFCDPGGTSPSKISHQSRSTLSKEPSSWFMAYMEEKEEDWESSENSWHEDIALTA